MDEHTIYGLFHSTVPTYNDIYPLIIIADRYTGVYSGGNFTAWNCELDEIPKAIDGDDTECMEFWWESQLHPETYVVCGIGNTPEEAIISLIQNLKRVETENALNK